MKGLLKVALILGLCCVVCACGGKKQQVPAPAQACLTDPIVMEGDGSVASPPPCMRSCMEDSECTAVNTSCPGCCEFVALSKSYQEHYERLRGEECRKYHGLVCGCSEKPQKAHCVGHVCTLK